MIILDLNYWNARWRPWRELAFMQGGASRPKQLEAANDVMLSALPSQFFRRRSEYLD